MKSLEQELRDGNYDINDVLNDETSERRVFLARMGRDVEALAGTLESDVLVALIENGYAEDYYDDWCFHASSNVRKALAHKGYYPERFIHDPSSVVRMAVIDAHPDMVTELLRDGNTENWRHVYDRVLEKREPKVIQQFVNNPIDMCHHTRYYDTICEYAMALNIELTPFEATMSPAQLFRMGNPRWMIGMTFGMIKRVQDTYRRVEGTDKCELFYDNFDDLMNTKTYWDAHERIFG